MNILAFFRFGTWLGENSVASGLVLLSLIATLGLILGAIRVRGIRLGVSGVLFSALLFGQLGLTIDSRVIDFLRDFSLVIFMYAIGLEVGPSFLTSLRTSGLRLNLLALLTIGLGAGMTLLICRSLPPGASPGVFVGSFTTTAGLAAAQESLRGMLSAEGGKAAAAEAALAYSITYPLGIVGPMLVIQMLSGLFRVNLAEERKALLAIQTHGRPQIEFIDFELTETSQVGRRLEDLPLVRKNTIIFSRMLRGNVLSVPSAETELQVGDIYRAVGPREGVEELVAAMGRRSSKDLTLVVGNIERAELTVTRTGVLHRPLHELNLVHRTGYTITTVHRAGVDLIATGLTRLAFADRVIVVGPRACLKLIESELGNSPESLDQPRLVPIFLGIALGVIVGTLPLALPGLHSTVRLGLAGGPLIVAIVLAQLGNLGSIIWYMPTASNRLFRDFGLAIFLACVGLRAGDGFIQRAATESGAAMVLCGVAMSIIPVFVVGCLARFFLRVNFITLTGWVAGTMGNSTTLLFAGEFTDSDAPALAYAAVTPLATLVPILFAQFLAITR